VISLSLISQGDSDCHAYDLSSMEKVATYVGHGDYLHAIVALEKTQRIATASEGSRPLRSFVHPRPLMPHHISKAVSFVTGCDNTDGTVRLWDTRNRSEIGVVEPFERVPPSNLQSAARCKRLVSSCWVSCIAVRVAVSLVCGAQKLSKHGAHRRTLVKTG
jgi:WD40 repeat protein